MNKNQLTPKQKQINRGIAADTDSTNAWLLEQGLNPSTFGKTPLRLLQAQHQAQQLITHHGNLLSASQRQTLTQFLERMNCAKSRLRFSVKAAQPILNITTKINRQLFKQHRQLTKA